MKVITNAMRYTYQDRDKQTQRCNLNACVIIQNGLGISTSQRGRGWEDAPTNRNIHIFDKSEKATFCELNAGLHHFSTERTLSGADLNTMCQVCAEKLFRNYVQNIRIWSPGNGGEIE